MQKRGQIREKENKKLREEVALNREYYEENMRLEEEKEALRQPLQDTEVKITEKIPEVQAIVTEKTKNWSEEKEKRKIELREITRQQKQTVRRRWKER